MSQSTEQAFYDHINVYSLFQLGLSLGVGMLLMLYKIFQYHPRKNPAQNVSQQNALARE